MKLKLKVKSEIEIPDHLYNEAVELFLNHLRKYCEGQLLKDGYFPASLPIPTESKSIRIVVQTPLSLYGKSCPVYYKKRKDSHSV